jgi:PAS domain S-box-containing protein
MNGHPTLLIEDNPGDARLINEMLKEANGEFAIMWVDQLADGLRELRQKPIDIVILDLNLPDSRGLATFSRLQAEFPRPPVVILTGLHDSELALRAVSTGAQDYLTKGEISPSALLRVLRYGIERKRGEQARTRLAAIVEFSDDAIIAETLDGIIESWNRGAERLYGYSAGEVVGRSVAILLPSDRPEELSSALERIGRGESVEHYETQRVRKDGRLIDVSMTVSPIRDGAGKVTGASTVARDITERKRAEEEIRQLNASLERRVAERTAELAAANEELEAFTYSVAHDLRAPLRGMEGFSALLLEDYAGKLDEEARNYLQRIRAASLRMAQLIDDLLNLSRISRSEVRKERVDLSALALAVVSDLQKSDPERPAEFTIPAGIEAEGDSHLLRVALENLLGNAWKFSAQRRPARIELGVAEQNGRKSCFIRDNGAGFDMAYAGKLFAPFQRLHSANEFPGTGIGLVTVARIVRKHGGEVWAEGAVDKGATFYFTLGKEPVNSQESKVESQTPPAKRVA